MSKSDKQALKDADWWKVLAGYCGASLFGFSHLYSATFRWPTGSHSYIDREMRDCLCRLTGHVLPKEGVK